MLLLILLGCPHPAPPPPLESVAPAGVTDGRQRVEVDGPVTWIMDEAPSLCLPVPEGWMGTTGPAPTVLDLRDAHGVRITLSVSPTGFATERAGYELLFEDEGAYRAVPLLAGGGTRSWQATDPDGPLVQAWYGTVNGQIVEAAVEAPLGEGVDGVDDALVVLAGLCSTS